MNKINEIISQKNWDLLIANYSAKDICSFFNFNEAMHLMDSLFFDDFRNDENQQYALKLAFEIKNYFKEEWESDWKNDVFLGSLCSFLCLYDEQYLCYKRAYDKLADPPASLLLYLAGCNSAPGTPPISDEESEFYLKKSAEKRITYETALMMRTLSEKKGDKPQYEYWDQLYKELEKKHIHAEGMIPEVFKVSALKKFISRKNWSYIISSYSVKDVCSLLNFNEAMHLVNSLFSGNIQNDENQHYALNLALEIKNHFKEEWESDRKNDVFLESIDKPS